MSLTDKIFVFNIALKFQSDQIKMAELPDWAVHPIEETIFIKFRPKILILFKFIFSLCQVLTAMYILKNTH